MKPDLKVLAAISYMARRHEPQRRKDGKTPYAAHPMRVLFIVRDVFEVTDSDTLAAAVLHDLLEDTPADRESLSSRFGETVADYVSRLSKDMRLPEREREERYLERIVSAPLPVRLVKLADLLDNLLDCHGLGEKAVRKGLDRARSMLAALEPTLPPERAGIVALVRQQIDAAEADL